MSAEHPDPHSRPGADRSPANLVLALQAIAVALVMLSLAGAVVLLAEFDQAGGLSAWVLIAALAGVLVAVGLGALLWAGAYVVRTQYRNRVRSELQSHSAEADAPGAPASRESSPPSASLADWFGPAPAASDASDRLLERQTELLERILARLSQVHDALLLDPEQRRGQAEVRRNTASAELVGRTEAAIEAGDFAHAEATLEQLAEEFAADSRVEEMRGRLDRQRQQRERDDLKDAIRQAEDQMSVGRFDDALATAEQLRRRIPDSQVPKQLIERVRREAEAYTAERRRRLYMDVEKLVEQRQWRAAIQAARRFLDEYPDRAEAELIHVQMPTLEANARIEEVREHRDRIRDFVERKRYAEAVNIAQQVIRDYPETVAASELREQLPRLRQRADSDSGFDWP